MPKLNDLRFATQHALDQFLKKLITAEIDNIIRIGDTTESALLRAKDFKSVVYPSVKPHRERRQIFESHRDLEPLQLKINSLLKDVFRYPYSWEAVKPILKHEFPGLYHQFDSASSWAEWRGDIRAMMHRLGGLINTDKPKRTVEEIAESDDIWELSKTERARVMQHLLKVSAHTTIVTQLVTLAKEHRTETDQLKAQHNESARRCLEKADVIGILATKIPEIIEVLGRINAKVVICEEAGEILEGHLINAIPPSCQHLIQIGDHLQLRPLINSYSLSIESDSGKKYRLDESMFEQLISQNLLPVVRLNVQRRMREDIADLLRCTLGEELQDHPAVAKYPDVLGMNRSVFWLDHSNPEAELGQNAKMPINDWEARMVQEIVCHLVRQGQYGTKDIVVLTPYPSQLYRLQQYLNSDFVTILCEEDKEDLAREGLAPNNREKPNRNQRSSVTGSAFKDALRVATM